MKVHVSHPHWSARLAAHPGCSRRRLGRSTKLGQAGTCTAAPNRPAAPMCVAASSRAGAKRTTRLSHFQARNTASHESSSLQQRNAVLEMAVVALGEALEANCGGLPATGDGPLQVVMEQLRGAGVSIGDAASYVPFSPGQVSGQRGNSKAAPWTSPNVGAAVIEQGTPPSDASASPGAEEPEWLVDAAATLAAEKDP